MKKIRSWIALVLIAVLLFTLLTGCSSQKKQEQKKKGYVCRICGWVYEGESLPEDIVCPICKHGAEDFEEIK